MARPAASAASTTSPSLTEPPGWTTAVTPASARTSSPSGNGKKASLAPAPPFARSPAFCTAISAATTRDCWPAPAPAARPPAGDDGDRVGRRAAADAPGQDEVAPFVVGGRALGHHRPVRTRRDE